MISKTQGIVLKTIKYNDKNFICRIYTREFGKESFFFRGSGANKKFSIGMLQAGSIIEIITDFNALKSINNVNEAKWAWIYKKDYFEIKRNCIAMFLVDLISQVVLLPEKNETLFDFFLHSFMKNNTIDNKYIYNMPLLFSYFFLKNIGHDLSEEICKQIVKERIKKDIEIENIKNKLNEINTYESDIKLEEVEKKYAFEIILWHFVYCLPNFSIPKSLKIIKSILY